MQKVLTDLKDKQLIEGKGIILYFKYNHILIYINKEINAKQQFQKALFFSSQHPLNFWNNKKIQNYNKKKQHQTEEYQCAQIRKKPQCSSQYEIYLQDICSSPNVQNLITLNQYGLIKIQKNCIKDCLSPTRLSKIRIGRNTLKFSEHISNEPSPSVIVNNHKIEDQIKEVQKRKSCDCSECGKQSLFQRDTMNYGVQINHLIKEQESAINKFKRSIRKQQTLLFPQYLNTPKNSTTNENIVEEIQILRDDVMIKSFAHRPTLSSLVLEEQVSTNKQSPINSQSRIKNSYFESFLVKQQKLMNYERQQFSRQTGLFESLHKKSNFSNKNTQMHTPTVLTPRSPASSFVTGFPSQSPVKRNNQINVYLQPQKSKFFKNQNRIITLPEVHQ